MPVRNNNLNLSVILNFDFEANYLKAAVINNTLYIKLRMNKGNNSSFLVC